MVLFVNKRQTKSLPRMSHNPAVIKSKEKDKAALAFSMYFRITIQQRKRASPHIKVKK